MFWAGLLAPKANALQLPQPQQTPAARKSTPSRNNEIQNLVVAARSLPAEFAIDILLRIASSNSVDKQRKQQLLEDAFILSSEVQNALREKVIPIPGASVDRRSSYRSYAFDLKLDTLSIRIRIIDQMFSLDKSRALRMLEQVSPKLTFRNLSCSDQTIYDVGDFYRVLERITRSAYDEKQIQQGERVQFLLPYIENMTSPVQISPLANLLIGVGLKPREAIIVTQAFAHALRKISVDDRLFTAALKQDRTTYSLIRLIDWAGKNEVLSTDLGKAYRVYLSKHLTGTRCEDNVKGIGDELPNYVREINYFYHGDPFTPDEIKASRVEHGPPKQEYFESPDSKRLQDNFKTLRGYDDVDPSAEELKSSASWQEKMLDYLRQLETWNSNSESSVDSLHQKSNLYMALLQIVPAGNAADQVVVSYVKLLSQDSSMQESRIEWLWHVNDLIRYLRERPPRERNRLLGVIQDSKNPVLQVYVELTKANLF